MEGKKTLMGIRPVTGWLAITAILLFSTVFSYALKEQEKKLTVSMQERLTGTLNRTYLLQSKLLATVDEKSRLEKELGDTRNILNMERAAKNEMESRLASLTREIQELKSTVNLNKIVLKEPKGPLEASLDAGKTGNISQIKKGKKFTIDLGLNQDIKKKDILSVYRDGDFIGKAEVVYTGRKGSTASILPDWQDVEFRKDDVVRFEK